MSKFYIYNKDRTRLGLLQHEESVQWLEHYNRPGEVKITARATAENMVMLSNGNRIYNTDSSTTAIIKDVVTSETATERTIIVTAAMSLQQLDQRVVMATYQVKNVEAAIYGIYQENRRNLSLSCSNPAGLPGVIEKEITWGSVLEAVTQLADDADYGLTVDFTPENGFERLRVYKGTDRTDRASGCFVGYFSQALGNLNEVKVINGSMDYKNVAVVAGEGEGLARKVRIVSLGEQLGDDRYELFVDARDLQRKYQKLTPTGKYDSYGNPIYDSTEATYTEKQYDAILDQRGYDKLSERIREFVISCVVNPKNLKLDKDYFLGDRMPVVLGTFGIQASARIGSVERIYERAGNKVVLTLDNFELEG